MGKKTIYNIGNDRRLAGLPVMVLLSLSLACGLFFSCTASVDEPEGLSASDRNGATALDGQTSVRLVISAKDMGALYVTRTTDYDTNAEDGEFMYTLCVFIVDNTTGVIEKKIQRDFTDTTSEYYEGTDGSDLPVYEVELDDLTAGEKTIYAFSNWDNMACDKWDALIAKEEDDEITDDDLAFAVDDPASKVDIANGKYIPMSGKKVVSITSGTENNITCGLDRLVSKVKLTLSGDKEVAVPILTYTFSGITDKVDLFSDISSNAEISYDEKCDLLAEKYALTDEDSEIMTIPAEGTKSVTFYVNESNRSNSELSDGYTIELVTKSTNDYAKYDGVTYTATTARQDIPRNSIYPISLTLDNYEFTIKVEASQTGIENPVDFFYNSNRYDENYPYLIKLLDMTVSFYIEPHLVDSEGNEISDVSYDWSCDNPGGSFKMTWNDDEKHLFCTGLTASGYDWYFSVSVYWTTSTGVSHKRTYNLDIRSRSSYSESVEWYIYDSEGNIIAGPFPY